jgi:uncharacterized protein with von Willebrand factor type A (vWA) domain
MTPSHGFLPAVDRAAFAAALTDRLRRRGVPVELTAAGDLAVALRASWPETRTALYWTARITLVRDQPFLERFDEVFDAVFGDAVLSMDPNTRRTDPHSAAAHGESEPLGTSAEASDLTLNGSGLPWRTLPAALTLAEQDGEHDLTIAHRLSASLTGALNLPFEQLSAQDVELLGRWLTTALRDWPRRRSRRQAVRPGGPRIALRETAARARRTGWEPVQLVRTGPVRRPRPVVVVCDVSRSMQAHAVPYLHLMRVLSLTTRAETFAFATTLTRLTTVLAHRSPETAFEEATRRVTDRFGGTRIAHCMEELLASPHNGALRGAVVLIASDGWDADPPDRLAEVMERIHRRAHTVVWLNPRAAAPGFAPRTTTMRAALPYIDLLLAADTFAALLRVPEEIARFANLPPPSAENSRKSQLQSVTWIAGRNRPAVTPAPRSMA